MKVVLWLGWMPVIYHRRRWLATATTQHRQNPDLTQHLKWHTLCHHSQDDLGLADERGGLNDTRPALFRLRKRCGARVLDGATADRIDGRGKGEDSRPDGCPEVLFGCRTAG